MNKIYVTLIGAALLQSPLTTQAKLHFADDKPTENQQAVLEEFVISGLALAELQRPTFGIKMTMFVNTKGITKREFEQYSTKLMQKIATHSNHVLQEYVQQCFAEKSHDFCAQLDTAYQAGLQNKEKQFGAKMKELGIKILKYQIDARTATWQKQHPNETSAIRTAATSPDLASRVKLESNTNARFDKTYKTLKELWEQK